MSTVEIIDEALACEARVKASRQQNDPIATLRIARDGADFVTKRLMSKTQSQWTDEDKLALASVKRFTYNAAADAWPGWQLDGPHLDTTTLTAAKTMAQRSVDLVAALQLGNIQEATGLWLVGAFNLALGDLDEALALFTQASELYSAAQAPGLVLLTSGYATITTGLARKFTLADMTRDLESICTKISSGAFEDGQAWIEQLKTALAVFTQLDC